MSPRLRAISQAFLVTFLWSTSWPLIKIGLQDLPPLTFAGARYFLAALVLWLTTIGRSRLDRNKGRTAPVRRVGWGLLVVLGLIGFAIPPGAQFIGLNFLPATDASLLLNFIAIATALLSALVVREAPTLAQSVGILVALGAALGYFYPFSFTQNELLGVLANVGGITAVAIHTVIMRGLMRDEGYSVLRLTRNMMTIGGVALLGTGLLVEGLPSPTPRVLGIVVVLAVVNTAFTFTLWNHTLRVLTAPEQAVIGNTMLIQIAILVWLTLGERPTTLQIGFLLVVAVATAWVQWKGREARPVVAAEQAAVEDGTAG